MDKTRIEAIRHQVTGALKEGLGKIIGDAKLQSDGAADRAAAKVHVAGPDRSPGSTPTGSRASGDSSPAP